MRDTWEGLAREGENIAHDAGSGAGGPIGISSFQAHGGE